MMITVEHIDHFILTVASIKRACRFYSEKLGIKILDLENGEKALRLGKHRINLRQLGCELEPKARNVHPGSADISLITTTPIEEVLKELRQKKVQVISEIFTRTGVKGQQKSIYLYDPDGNLIEISNDTKL